MDDFINLIDIGEGAYGVVYKGQNKLTGQLVAIKKTKLDSGDGGVPYSAIREISLLKEMNHPNIVKLVDVVMDESLYLIFEYLSMDLKHYMDSFGKVMDPALVKSYLYQINSAVLYCHQRRILHRDLKPANLLIDKTGIIKVADFGMGRTFTESVRVYTNQVATLWYKAPELLLGGERYCCPIDMWSVGCIFSEMSSKKPLFKGASEIDQLFRIFRILRTPTEEIWPGVSLLPHYMPTFPKWNSFELHNHVKNLDEVGMDLLQKMLIYDPVKRISAKVASQHQYFNDVRLPPGLAKPSANSGQCCQVSALSKNNAPKPESNNRVAPDKPMSKEVAANSSSSPGALNGDDVSKPPPSPPAADNALLPDVIA